MKRGLSFAGALAAGVWLAAAAPEVVAQALTPQQELMKTCNQQARDKSLAGDARREFMSGCLRGEDNSKLTAQQLRMRACNRQAGEQELKGNTRKDFMSRCLRG